MNQSKSARPAQIAPRHFSLQLRPIDSRSQATQRIEKTMVCRDTREMRL